MNYEVTLVERRNTYLACEDMDFAWELKDVHQVEDWWRKGISLTDISSQLNREPEEVFILLMDRAKKDRIHNRHGGLYGGEPESEYTPDQLTYNVYLSERGNGLVDKQIAAKYGIAYGTLRNKVSKWKHR